MALKMVLDPFMSDVDLVNGLLVQQAHAVPDASGVAGVWKTPATPVAFTIQVDPNAGYWSIFGPAGYATQRGQGSVLLGHTLRRLGLIQ
jgi:hypothetical protein